MPRERRLGSRQTEEGLGRRDPRTRGPEGGRTGPASCPAPTGQGAEGNEVSDPVRGP